MPVRGDILDAFGNKVTLPDPFGSLDAADLASIVNQYPEKYCAADGYHRLEE